ncbi:DNA-binding protein [Desulforhopalus sp. 52FAK]
MYSRFSLAAVGLFCLLVSFSPGNSAAMPGLASPSGEDVVSGTVKETMNASGYTYMLVDADGKEAWVAIPEAQVKAGATVNYFAGMEMTSFNSKTLNRTFDSIIFSPGLASDTPAQAPVATTESNDSFASAVKAEQSAPSAAAINDTQASGGSSGAIVPLAEISVEKAVSPNGYSVAELFSQAKELSGKKVQIKGQVVKVSPAIMGRNWVHLQDGTGDPMNNTHDLVVTTNETVELDAVVTFEGVIIANKDFGAGYKYDAIVEEAALIQ